MKQFLEPYLGEILTAIIAGLGGWFFERKRKKVELKSSEYSALSGMQENYARFIEHSEQKFLNLEKEMGELKGELERVEKFWKQKYDALKRQFENYKKEHP